MVRLNWQGQHLTIDRLVFRQEHRDAYVKTLNELAVRLHLDLGDAAAEPRAGDFWIGCQPRSGWGNAEPELIGFASVIEVPLAVGLLKLSSLEAVEEATTPIRIATESASGISRLVAG